MSYMLVRHKVEDYSKWKPIFDEHGAVRKTAGCKGGIVFRNSDAPNEVIILFKWDNKENARKFSEAADLRETMQKAGVIDKPDIYFLDEADITFV